MHGGLSNDDDDEDDEDDCIDIKDVNLNCSQLKLVFLLFLNRNFPCLQSNRKQVCYIVNLCLCIERFSLLFISAVIRLRFRLALSTVSNIQICSLVVVAK